MILVSDKPLADVKHNNDAKMVLAFLMVFCAIFTSFEVVNPIAELVHNYTHAMCGGDGPNTHGAEDLSYSHGPTVLSSTNGSTITSATNAHIYFRFNHPLEPFMETPSPVPIHPS